MGSAKLASCAALEARNATASRTGLRVSPEFSAIPRADFVALAPHDWNRVTTCPKTTGSQTAATSLMRSHMLCRALVFLARFIRLHDAPKYLRMDKSRSAASRSWSRTTHYLRRACSGTPGTRHIASPRPDVPAARSSTAGRIWYFAHNDPSDSGHVAFRLCRRQFVALRLHTADRPLQLIVR